MKIYTNVDLRYNEIQNARIQRVAPSNPVEGTIYYDEANNRIRYYTGSSWISVGGDGGGGQGGDLNVLEQVNVNGTNLRIDNTKTVKLDFSTLGGGNLTIKDGNSNLVISTLNIGSGGIQPEDIIAVGSLKQGESEYILVHELDTDYLVVQVIDSLGNTVECDVRRYTDNGRRLIKITFSQRTDQTYRVIAIGYPRYSLMTENINNKLNS